MKEFEHGIRSICLNEPSSSFLSILRKYLSCLPMHWWYLS